LSLEEKLQTVGTIDLHRVITIGSEDSKSVWVVAEIRDASAVGE
jgi:hypothetical protein